MKAFAPIAVVIALLAAVPLIVHSNVTLNFLVVALMIALAGQGWNILGGYGGQYSFGHAAFFGTGAYVTAILQVRYGVNAWLAFGLGIAAGAALGALIGGLTFRSGLRGSYFALVTLAFAEVLRIVASVAPITGAGVGTLIKLDLRARGAAVREPRRVLLGDPGAGRRGAGHYASDRALALRRLADRGARERGRGHGARRRRHRGQARRHDHFRRHHGRRRLLLCAVFPVRRFRHRLWHLDIDRGAADADHRRRRHGVRPAARRAGGQGAGRRRPDGGTGEAPGLDLVVFGCVLVLVIWFSPRGLIGVGAELRKRFRRAGTRPVAQEARHG